jgi:hypothetical protein
MKNADIDKLIEHYFFNGGYVTVAMDPHGNRYVKVWINEAEDESLCPSVSVSVTTMIDSTDCPLTEKTKTAIEKIREKTLSRFVSP